MRESESSALIGYTGFVGSNLLRQRRFDACFNSTNIEELGGRSFDLIVCAGARAEKWKANAEPERDRDNIECLIRALSRADARRLVLISTVDVFGNPTGVDETSRVSTTGLHAYGRNRRLLEEVLSSRFDACVARLPGLYGPGLKKNAIFDLLHDHDTEKIDSRGVFQFYGVERLWRDVTIALDNELRLVHLVTPPVSVADIASHAFDTDFRNEVAASPAAYDVRTRHAVLFGGSGDYIETQARELAGIADFVKRERMGEHSA